MIWIFEKKNLLFTIQYICSVIDLRSGYCFSRIEDDQCLLTNLMNISRASCCCSMAGGWGYPGCEPCPAKETEEFSYLCSSAGFVKGKGMRLNYLEKLCGRKFYLSISLYSYQISKGLDLLRAIVHCYLKRFSLINRKLYKRDNC